MEEKDRAIRELHEKIEELAKKHKSIYEEIRQLHNQVFELDLKERSVSQTPAQKTEAKVQSAEKPVEKIETPPRVTTVPSVTSQASTAKVQRPAAKTSRTPTEEFIGTNLLNKVGIAVLVLGIGFGTKYSIDHNLINPLTRIIMGYFWGLVLVGLSMRLKKSHLNFSAVLLSGGLAIFYFVTFSAYEFYELIPQEMAFVLMVIFTAFTVFAAVQYNQQVIGIIGLVGAYAVPFLLSDGSGRVIILFSYISIINTGILILGFKKNWKWLYYLAFTLTWASFIAWFTSQYNEEKHLWISLGFSTIFFITFYTTFLSYKLVRKEPLSKVDLAFMLLNSFVYYSYGYAAIDLVKNGEEFLGLFTLLTALIHFLACVVVFKQQSQFKDIFYFVAGMVLVFLTLTVPVQLDGNWVTLIWAMEALLLFWIGRTKQFPVYEYLSYPLILLALVSLTHDWSSSYPSESAYYGGNVIWLPFLRNVQFLTSLLVAASFFCVLWLSNKYAQVAPFKGNKFYPQALSWSLGAFGLLALYLAFYLEIASYWHERYATSVAQIPYEGGTYAQANDDLLRFRNIWLICYSAIFAIAFSLVQRLWLKAVGTMYVAMAINACVIATMLFVGLYELSELRYVYLHDFDNIYFIRDVGHIAIRYLMLALAIPLLVFNHQYCKAVAFDDFFREIERILLHIVALTFLSSELVHWLNMADVHDSFKLALSILWGVYALALVVYGLKANAKPLRILAIVIFAVTLIKLFVYDIADMSTIAKTIVMMALGILLLTASFLYNKVKRSSNETV